jgi:predicted metal-binding membrane protein
MIMVGQEARLAQPIDRRHKRVMLATVVCILVAVAAVVVYGAHQSNTYGKSANGCVTVNFASEMGAATIHQCGSAAREFCRFEDARDDAEARLVIPQCRLAGYPQVPAAGSGTGATAQR